jgi:hypothetical protein
VELAGDLEVQRGLGHIRRLHDPVDTALIVGCGAALDIVERRFLAQRL